MADTEDVTNALEGTNLADGDAAIATPPPGTVMLVSSDGYRFHVDRQRLALESTVFSDMFELADSVESGQSCDLTKSKSHLDALFAALWKELKYAKDWLAVYRMGDKYDVKRVRLVLLLWAWRSVNTPRSYHAVDSARDVYAAGLLLGDDELVESAAEIALKCEDMDAPGNPIFDALDASAQRRLRVFARARREASLNALLHVNPKRKNCRCRRSSGRHFSDTAYQVWEDAQSLVGKTLQPATDVPDAMRREIARQITRLEGCNDCWWTLSDKLDMLERQWPSCKSRVTSVDIAVVAAA